MATRTGRRPCRVGRRAYEFYEKNLKDLGYKVRAEIMNYPDGDLGEVGIFLRW